MLFVRDASVGNDIAYCTYTAPNPLFANGATPTLVVNPANALTIYRNYSIDSFRWNIGVQANQVNVTGKDEHIVVKLHKIELFSSSRA